MANEGAIVTHESNCRYDIFLSFRGQDTRHTFTGYLFDALRWKGFNTFMDDVGLQSGDQISLFLLKAIEESRISIVVLSQDYASSSWCLDELVKILECMKLKNQLVWPIFYKVAPSDVRYQGNSYGEAMAKHENRFGKDSEKVQKWRSALFEVANLKGWHFETGYEYKFIQRIVELATVKLHREQLYVGEHVIEHQFQIEEVKSLLDIESCNTVCMVGIHGTGGMGKTTLAKAIYNLIVDQFECAIFLEGVRERSNSYMGLVHLQEAILSKLFEGENVKLGSVGEGVTSLKDRLCHRRVLLVLDDVDSEDQLEKLAGECNWFGSGSRIIITTRDKHVLNVHKVERRYEMEGLNDHEALQLFCWSAFKTSQPATNYEDVSNRAVRYGNGLPLALKVIGSNLVGKSVEECECALEQYERIPERKIQDILKISYDCLPENAQNIFLDIACFFKGERREYVEKILDRCDFYPTFNIGILVDKSLLTIEHDCLWMHDLIQDMGKEIVRQDAPKKLGERSRLCFHEDILSVLTENLGSNNIEGIILDPPKEVEVEWSGTAFEKMNNLRILIVRNARFSLAPNYLPNSLRLIDWKGYPSESLPNYPNKVVVLRLLDSHLRLEKEKAFPRLMQLTDIDFSNCQFITHIPDLSGVPNLRNLRVTECKNLVEVHDSVGFLKHLETLCAPGCTNLVIFPRRIWLPSLKYLDLWNTRIEFFPDVEGVMDKPLTIDLKSTQITGLPFSVSNLTGLARIKMFLCNNLRSLPNNLFILPKIVRLYLQGNHEVRESFRRFRNSHVITMTSHSNLNKPCYSPLQMLYFEDGGLTDEDLDFILSCFPNLEWLRVPRNNFVSLPASIKDSTKLRILDVSHSTTLEEIPNLPLSIKEVYATHCPFLTSETSRMLWYLAFKEVYYFRVQMPWSQTQFPDWFDHHCEGGTVSFWFRGKLPAFALAFVLEENVPTSSMTRHMYDRRPDNKFEISLSFNTIKSVDTITGRKSEDDIVDASIIAGDHVLLCDLHFIEEDWPIFDEWTCLKAVLNSHVRRFFVPLKVRYWGVYVYKQEANMEDIQFTCPNPLKRTPSILHNPPKKRVRKLKPGSGGRKDKIRARRRSTQFPKTLSSRRRMKKIVFPMSKCFWRFLYYGFSVSKQQN